MESLQATYREDEGEAEAPAAEAIDHRNGDEPPQIDVGLSRNGELSRQEEQLVSALSESDPTTSNDTEKPTPKSGEIEAAIDRRSGEEPAQIDMGVSQNGELSKQEEQLVSALSDTDPTTSNDTEKPTSKSPKSGEIEEEEEDDDEEEEEDPPLKKQKQLSSLNQHQQEGEVAIDSNGAGNGNHESSEIKTPVTTQAAAKKKSKKKNGNNVWVTRSTRKGKKKAKPNPQNTPAEDKVLITPVPRFLDKTDDTPEMKICLSKVFKAEKVELSEDRMTAGSTKGYRMVRATRGVCEGAWYFEVKVVKLGETGHTRLGWTMEKGDLQAPVGYDANSFGYRDIDGSKVHKAVREKYGDEGYKEGDVIGFYISLPEGELYNPKPPRMVWYKNQRYVCAPDSKEDPPKVVPGSEIAFFKNGVCQGTAFEDLNGGRYYPAASMYTLPNQPNCEVKFNFGPNFEHFPEDFGGRPVPRPMYEVPYHVFDSPAENGVSTEAKP